MQHISQYILKKLTGEKHLNAAYYGVYEASIHEEAHYTVFMAKDATGSDHLYTYGEEQPLLGSPLTRNGVSYMDCPLSHENAAVLRKLYPFCAPIPVLSSRKCTFGVGDRIARATPGHIRVFEKYDVTPVFAQQSLRELNLTGRNYRTLLDDVTFFVFREGYTDGYGADGDHLKHEDDIKDALDCGYTMITLDLNEQICPADREHLLEVNDELRTYYCDAPFSLKDGQVIRFTEEELKEAVTVYGKALDFTADIYKRFFASEDCRAELEISIDEISVPTTPTQHFFVANELTRRGVNFATIAPRFIGEFQKGIDYVGDVETFTRDLKVHQAIADTFGYKLSIHSGSDKFSVFPSIGEVTKGHFHIKTSGTNWLEAMRLIAMERPALYRNIHRYALAVFEQATAYYHVTTDLRAIPDVDTLPDEDLPLLLEASDSRQMIHITYGLILNHPIFGKELQKVWDRKSELYAKLVEEHITQHMEYLKIPYIGAKKCPKI